MCIVCEGIEQAKKAYDDWAKDLGREPTDEEILEWMNQWNQSVLEKALIRQGSINLN